jgi:VanZ family protein
MASSSIVLGGYAPHTEVKRPLPWRFLAWTWLPVLLCASVFAVESTSYFGWEHTNAPLRRVAEALCGSGVDAHWPLLHHLIRKTGHFVGYGVFALVCFRGFWLALPRTGSRLLRQLRAHGLAILCTFLVGGTDEWHQSFLPNRTAQFSDVLLDTCGGVVLCLALFLAMTWIGRCKEARSKRTNSVRRLAPAQTAA